jgi:hypothetical protein
MHAVEPSRGSVAAALRALRDADAASGASDAVRARLQAEVRAIGARRRQARLVTLAAAAVLVLAIAAPLWRLAVTLPPIPEMHTASREVVTDFFPLAYGSVPVTGGQLVRLEVPRKALAAFGLGAVEPLDLRGADTLLADVLVGEDGLARAVRFVQPIRTQEQR